MKTVPFAMRMMSPAQNTVQQSVVQKTGRVWEKLSLTEESSPTEDAGDPEYAFCTAEDSFVPVPKWKTISKKTRTVPRTDQRM